MRRPTARGATIVVYPGAYHDFDRANFPLRELTGTDLFGRWFRQSPRRHERRRAGRRAQARARVAFAVARIGCVLINPKRGSRFEQAALSGVAVGARRRPTAAQDAARAWYRRRAATTTSASARTRPSENSMSIRSPGVTAAACRSGRPSRSRTSAKPRRARRDRTRGQQPLGPLHAGGAVVKQPLDGELRARSNRLRARSRARPIWVLRALT